jgi:Resolvase, N terminal domain
MSSTRSAARLTGPCSYESATRERARQIRKAAWRHRSRNCGRRDARSFSSSRCPRFNDARSWRRLSNSFGRPILWVVAKLDRLARSIPHLVRIIGTLEEKQATLRIVAMNLDTNTPTGRLLLNLVGSVAQFEREIMLERQREGVAKAKAEGKYKGRKPTARAKSGDVIAKFKADQRPTDIAKSIGIGRASVYRILNDAGLVNGQRASSAGGQTPA